MNAGLYKDEWEGCGRGLFQGNFRQLAQERNTMNNVQDGRCVGRDSKRLRLKYKPAASTPFGQIDPVFLNRCAATF